MSVSDDDYMEDDALGELSENFSTKANVKAAGRRTSTEKAAISSRYQKMTQLEHIMKRPDTYIGSVEANADNSMWVVDADGKLEHRNVTYVPGLYKIFDEILVNAADHKQRDGSMKNLKVTINRETGAISVLNDGKGIPVEMHAEHDCYIPELIFGHLLTGENFDDTEERVVGGRNGYGAKLANIFSSEFTVETCEGKGGKSYKQTWTANMSKVGKPKIKASGAKSFTSITFTPDFNLFSMPDGLDDDIVALMTKRVYDIAGCTDKTLKVSLNGEHVPFNTFSAYVDKYLAAGHNTIGGNTAEDEKPIKIYEKINERWEVCVTASDGQPQQVSYVNSICTTKGGEHVKYIADQVAARMVEVIKKKEKGSTIKPKLVKNHLWVFVNAVVANPAFDSQCKDTLTTRWQKFGDSKFLPKLDEKFLKKLEKCGIVDNILAFSQKKQMRDLSRKGGGKKTKITGIPKLDDANNAGGKLSSQCTLILTEGDSAKSLAIAGLSVVGRDNYGVFPLKGKPLNVRDAGHAQIMKNEEIQAIMKIMGMQANKQYEDAKTLRYGHILIMADQDHDGSHIKGLLMNFIHHYWPSLLLVPGFLQVFITPIVKAVKGKESHTFYTMPAYEDWQASLTGPTKTWNVKYYKGLGTSTAKEAKEYFSDLEKHRLDMTWEGEEAGDALKMAFSKKRVEDRKRWLSAYEIGTQADYDVEAITYTDFVYKELILFSMADNMRSIPCVVDGLKPSQRKVLYSCFKRNLKKDIKVSQLAGYVSEHSAYHHGEMSLTSAIVGMAHDFVGSNNVNLLVPSGQFGTRLMGGKDAASSRYIFTRLAAITRKIFHPDDDALLDYLYEDGQSIEPQWYMPVIPLLLVNGSTGIGTGWSTDIPTYSPRDLIEACRARLDDEGVSSMLPWFRGFEGEVGKDMHAKKGFTGRFRVQGKFETDDEEHTVRITELPVGTWTNNYKNMLEEDKKSFPEGAILDVRENHTDVTVDFSVKLSDEFYNMLLKTDDFAKKFKMSSTVSVTNMHAFNAEGKITSYNSAERILNSFFDLRMEYYGKRKTHMETVLADELDKLSNMARFIQMVVDGELEINKKAKSVLVAELTQHGFRQIFVTAGDGKKNGKGKGAAADDSDDEEEDEDESGGKDKKNKKKKKAPASGYDYLLGMKLWSLTNEKVMELVGKRDGKKDELVALQAMSPSDLWRRDLNDLETGLDDVDLARAKEVEEMIEKARVAQTKRNAKGAKGKKRASKKGVSAGVAQSSAEALIAAMTRIKHEPTKASVTRTGKYDAVKVEEDEQAMDIVMMKKPKKETKAVVKKEAKVMVVKPKDIRRQLNGDSSSEAEDVDDDDDDGQIASLADRLKMRMNVTPKPAKKSASRVRAAAAATEKADDIFDSFSGDDNDEDEDVFNFATTPDAKPKNRKKRAKENTPIAVRAHLALSANASPARPSPAMKKVRSKTGAAVGKAKKAVAAAKPKAKAAPKAKGRVIKKAIDSTSEEEDEQDGDSDVEEMNCATPPPRAPRMRRGAAKKNAYVVADSSEEEEEDEQGAGESEEEEEVREVKKVEKKKTKKKVVEEVEFVDDDDDESSGEEEEEEDSDSDFEG